METLISPKSYSRMRWRLAFIRLRQWARSVCDRTGFGPSTTGRICCVLILGAILFGAILVLSFAHGTSPAGAITLALTVFLAVFGSGSALLLLGSDSQLDSWRKQLAQNLPEAKAVWQAYKANKVRLRAQRKAKRQTPPSPEATVAFDEEPGAGSPVGALRPFYSKVVGVTHANADRSQRQQIIAQCEQGERLRLVREPDNPHDPNAVAVVRLSGEQLGYLSSDLACEIAPRLDRGSRVDVEVAQVTGGEWFSDRSYGVNIKITKYRLR